MINCMAILLAVLVSAATAEDSYLSEIEHINSVQDLWKAGVNDVSNSSSKDMKRLFGVLSDSENDVPVKYEEIEKNIPKQFDARKHWKKCPSINSVKHQSDCGSCWAVAVATVMSDRLCIATNSKVRLNISVEHLLTCCKECAPAGGCNGGWTIRAWNYTVTTGLVTGGDYNSHEGCQPYKIPPTINFSDTPKCEKKCTNKKYKVPFIKDKHFNKNFYKIPNNNIEAIQTEIMKYGPVQVNMIVYKDLLHYKSGIYRHTTEEFCGFHAIRIVGWGVERGVEYWIVANSYGRGFGENGFFRIKRGTNECNIERGVTGAQIKY